jgi:hypothetical protein
MLNTMYNLPVMTYNIHHLATGADCGDVKWMACFSIGYSSDVITDHDIKPLLFSWHPLISLRTALMLCLTSLPYYQVTCTYQEVLHKIYQITYLFPNKVCHIFLSTVSKHLKFYIVNTIIYARGSPTFGANLQPLPGFLFDTGTASQNKLT